MLIPITVQKRSYFSLQSDIRQRNNVVTGMQRSPPRLARSSLFFPCFLKITTSKRKKRGLNYPFRNITVHTLNMEFCFLYTDPPGVLPSDPSIIKDKHSSKHSRKVLVPGISRTVLLGIFIFPFSFICPFFFFFLNDFIAGHAS